MRKRLAILLLISLSYGMLINAALIGDYALRLTYYATVLCENLDQPEMRCNGKCQLGKNLKAANNSSEKPQAPSLVSFKILANLPSLQFNATPPVFWDLNLTYFPYSDVGVLVNFTKIPTPPPEVVVC